MASAPASPADPAEPGAPPAPGPARRATGSHVILIVAMNWTRYAVMLGVSLVMSPMLVGAMGLALFGLHMFFALTRPALQDFIQPLLTRELSAAWSSGDAALRRRAFSAAFAASILAAAAALVLTLVLAPFNAFLPQLPEGSEGAVKLMILGEGLMLVLMLGAAPWVNLFMAAHRVVENNVHRTFERVQDLLVAVPVLWLARPNFIFWYILGRLVVRVLHVGVCVWRAHALEPDARVRRADIDGELVGHYAQAMGLSSSLPVSNQFYWYIDQVLFNAFFGPVFNGVYSLINTLRGYMRILGGGLFMGAEAVTADLHERGEHTITRRLLLAAMRSTAAITTFCAVVVGVFVGPLIQAWLGKKLAEDHALMDAGISTEQVVAIIWRFVLIMAPAVVVIEAGCSALTILLGMGHLRRFAPGLFIMTIAKVLLTWGALALFVGSWGRDAIHLAAWVTSITSIAMYGVQVPLLIRRVSGLGVAEQYRRVYLRPLISVVPVAAAGWAMTRWLGPWHPGVWSMTKLALCGCALGVIWLPIAAVLIPEEGAERDRVLGKVDRLGARIPGMGVVKQALIRAWGRGK